MRDISYVIQHGTGDHGGQRGGNSGRQRGTQFLRAPFITPLRNRHDPSSSRYLGNNTYSTGNNNNSAYPTQAPQTINAN
eukprot:2114810-Heterocapsa_arctica.AAC.1